MTTLRKAYGAKIEAIGERQARVICSTEEVDRAGEVVVQNGIDLTGFKANPIVLWQHNVDQPIAKATEIGPSDGKLMAMVEFPPAGISPKADEICGLVKSGVINAVSIGFNPLETEPMDKGNPKKGPQKYLACELAEFSFVSVPANKNALVVERQAKGDSANWKVGASRNLPLGEDGTWDGPAAEASIFEKAGFDGDSPDTSFARKGFLVYDAANPDLKGSYKLPFAKVVDGRLTAMPAGIRAAASRLPQADIPEDVAKSARTVIDGYEAKMKKLGMIGVTKSIKGLYDVAQLAYVLAQLGQIEDVAEWEAEMEGDESKVPAMLADAMRATADALLAMTAEEVSELLGEEDLPEVAGLTVAEQATVMEAATPLTKAIRIARAKAGRMISAANESTIREACKSISGGHDAIMGMLDMPDMSCDDNLPKDFALDTDRKNSADFARRQRMREVMQRQEIAA